MARIGLYFRTRQIISPQFGNWPVTVIRLMARVEFCLTEGGHTDPWEAILDTGAPVSILPRRLWRTLEKEIHVSEASFGGMSRRKVCQIPCSIGTVRGQLCDYAGHFSRVYDFPAILAKTDRVPLLIGFSGLLDHLVGHFDYQTGEAWVEEA
jgi:hypothetical protein